MAKFSWKVPVKGYKWASDSVEDDELYLTPIEDWCSRHYAPSDECTGLFRTFATTLTTREGVLAFANRFGHLGFGGAGVGGDVDDEWELRSNEEWRRVDETAKNEINMENFAAWCQQIKWLRQCVETWDAAQSGRGDEPTMQGLQETVSNQLRGRVKVAFQRDRHVGGFVLQIVPNNLLGLMWLQLAETIAGSKKHRACPTCGNWFEISAKKYRKSRHYCSEACRSSAYRSRKEQAQQMTAEGKTIKEIAAELGSDVKTVRGWLEQGKG